VILPDVNVLVYAFRQEAPEHESYAAWLDEVVEGPEELALHDLPLAAGDRALGGNLTPDAYLASLALTHGCRLATADRGFARFPALRWFDPIEE
jgi:predicted nucleic acid-binding protein